MTRSSTCLLVLALAGCLPRPPAWVDSGDSQTLPGQIALDPDEVAALSEVALGCRADVVVSVSNVGEGILVLSEVEMQDPVEGLDFDLNDDGGTRPLPWALEAGDQRNLGKIVYEPTELPPSNELGRLLVSSNDPEASESKILVEGSAIQPGSAFDEFTAGAHPMDVLFTVDHFGSTLDEVAALETGFWDFANTLWNHGIDYRIMAVTQVDGCVAVKPRWIDDSRNKDGATGLFSAMVDPQAPNESESSQGLQRALNALSSNNLESDGCNAGFLRQDAMLHVVGVSDEADGSHDKPDYYVDALTTMKASPYEAVFSAIGYPQSDCASSSQIYTGFVEAVDLTEGVFLSLCEDRWYDKLGSFALSMLERANRVTYPLTAKPNPSSIAVTVSSQVLSSGLWSYDEEANAVILDADQAKPALDADVRVDYELEVVCK